MADAYTILSIAPVVERIGPTRSRTVREITARATESGIVWYHRIQPADFKQPNLGIMLGTAAEWLNTLAAKPGVIAVDVEQDFNSQQTIDQTVLVTVESPSGNSVDDVRLTWGEAQGPNGYAKVAKARKLLDDMEGL